MSSTPHAPPPSVPFHFCLSPAPLFPFLFPSVTQGQPVPLLQSSLHSHTKFCPSFDSLFSPHPHLPHTSASLSKPMAILPNQRQGGSIHPPKYKEQNQRGEPESCQPSPRGEKKRPQMITKMLLAAMTTTAIQPQYQGCGGNKINCMFISPAQPGCLSRRKPRRRCLQSSAHHLPENQDTWWQLAYLSPNSHLL